MEKKDNKVKADVKKSKTKAEKARNITYDGAGDFSKAADGSYKGLYYIVLTTGFNRQHYEFKCYNFSKSAYNRILIHMSRISTAPGSDLDFSVDLNSPLFHPIEINLDTIKNYKTPRLTVTEPLQKNTDVEIILYHNDSLDTTIEDIFKKSTGPFIPNKIGYGTLKKI